MQKNPAAVKLLNQANISITALPRQPSNGPGAIQNLIQRPSGDSKSNYPTCEICEGYVKVSHCYKYSSTKKFIFFDISIVKNLFLGFGTIKKSYAMDPQSENSSENDIQQTSVKLSKMSIEILYGSRFRTSFVRLSWVGYDKHAREC